MAYSARRRSFVMAAASLPLLAMRPVSASAQDEAAAQLDKLEREFGGRLGVFALDTGNGAVLRHRADERFPFCSTFKVMLAGAILARSESASGLLQQRLHYRHSELVEYSPVTEKHLADGMTIAELCAAALQYSDNTAANLLIKTLGDPASVTAYARSIGDTVFRLDRRETELNTAIPGDPRDTTTPEAMARSLQRLALGPALAAQQREQLCTWLLGNTTGDSRIKAGVPRNWKVGDKTGTGSYGTANDVAVLWPPHREPVVMAVYTTQGAKDAAARSDIIAAAAWVVAGWLA
ncbi:MAG TPA: class A beta-lactamase [Noviherbaspirillum sp.]